MLQADQGLGPSDIVQIVGVIIALISSGVSVLIAYKALKHSQSQADVQRESFRLQYFNGLREWADEAVNLISESAFVCELDPKQIPPPESFRDRQLSLLQRLSAVIDRGRWFIPNEKEDDFGTEKEAAFRGFRHPVLDDIVEVFRIVEGLNYLEQADNRRRGGWIRTKKRSFVTHVQGVVRTRETKAIIDRLQLQASRET